MTIQRIPGEDRFWVQSRSRADVTHVVDLAYRDEPWLKPHAQCGCERSFCHGELCKHIEAVVRYHETTKATA